MTESPKPSAKPVGVEWWETDEIDEELFLDDLLYSYDQLPSVSGDDVVLNIDDRVVVHAGRVEGRPDAEPFVVGDTHTAYEWAVLLDDRHPYHPWWYTKSGYVTWPAVELTERAWAIFEALVVAYESGRIKHARAVWYERAPTERTRYRFRRDDVLKVLFEMGADDGIVIGMLLAERKRQAGSNVTHPESDNSAAAGGTKTVINETAKPKTVTQGKGGRKPRSGEIDDDRRLFEMLDFLATGRVPSKWAAAGAFANGSESVQRRLDRKFRKKWGTEPPSGKTWEDVKQDVERELNTN